MDHEGEVLETGLVKAEAISLGTIHGHGAGDLIASATETAKHLAGLVEKQKLYSVIQGRKFVRCEGWTTLAVMMGVLPREISNDPIPGTTGYKAVIALVRVADGVELTRASAQCGADEETWAKRPAYARQSMAATRATGKACRMAFSWVMQMAGFEPTPEEEMPSERHQPKRSRRAEPEVPRETGGNSVLVRFVNFSKKEGVARKTGKPYTIYEFHAEDGTVYKTLDHGHQKLVEGGHPEQLYRLEWTKNDYGDNKILKLTPVMEEAVDRPFEFTPETEIPEEEKPF